MEPQSSTRTEAEMITAILAGDTQLYHELILPHERSVYLMALAFMRNEPDAEDVAQEAFIKAFRGLASFRAESCFSTWLISITLNEARSRLCRQSIVRVEPLDGLPDADQNISPAMHAWCEIPSRTVEREEVRKLLQQAVETLPDISPWS